MKSADAELAEKIASIYFPKVNSASPRDSETAVPTANSISAPEAVTIADSTGKDDDLSSGQSGECMHISPDSDVNSYKFSKPRVYVKNCYDSVEVPHLDNLKFISENVGPKNRTPTYNQFIDRQLSLSTPSNRKSDGRKGQRKAVNMNNVDFSSCSLRLVEFVVQNQPIKALVDTGASHCLMSVRTFQQLKGIEFTPLKVAMKVAGSVLQENVVGTANIPITFVTQKGTVEIPLSFVIAKDINGYEAILGATFLLNAEIVSGLTPSHLCLSADYKSADLPLEVAKRDNEANFLRCEKTNILKGHVKVITAKLAGSLDCAAGTQLRIQSLLGGLSILNCILITPNSVQCTVENRTSVRYRLEPGDKLGLLHDPRGQAGRVATPHAVFNSMEATAVPTSGEQEEESIDEQIIAGHQLFDPSDLDKRYSYKDCEINPNLSPEIKEKLEKILADHQDVFAKSKLDVGEFKEFEVKLEINAEIPAEKQRFMSEEKLAYCNKTFLEFEKLNLVEEVHSPKTISNLLLVPKYEGLRDLTKASVYLAQVKGEKNTSFRIVQDLRRINAKTSNIKKALPKLPEFIFQKLKNKVVSSIDANQAYWHLKLHKESRPYTAFYLQKRTLQFCRMPQGLASAPACWDEAMSRIFSSKTMEKVKALLTPEERAKLPDDFETIIVFYQDDSWVISDTEEDHLLHLKVVLMAYQMHGIKLSPKKSTFFPETFKILGVNLSPKTAELSLDGLKAQSILEWEKPDSLYSLQSRLYALNYWMKFIPALAEVKFPLQQIVRSQIFSWNEEADLAWQRLKALIALDVRLTVPKQDEQLVLTTDASKIACSCILWVQRENSLRVVGCYSKLFSHTDTLKSIHFKETYAMVLAFDHFKPYLLNTQKSVIVFTDARALMWVGRNREYSIACNGLVNKLAKIQLEIPHVVYSVPSEVNFLADIFSRAFLTSRHLDKSQFALSKPQANNLPPLTEPFVLSEEALYRYFSLPLNPEKSDKFPRKKSKISTPKPISNLYKLFQDCTPEEKYLSALRLLKGWDDPSGKGKLTSEVNSSQVFEDGYPVTHTLTTPLRAAATPAAVAPSLAEVMKVKRPDLHTMCVEAAVQRTIDHLYSDLDHDLRAKVENTLRENGKKVLPENFDRVVRDDFVKFETVKEIVSSPAPLIPAPDDSVMSIGYSVIHKNGFHPKKGEAMGIMIPIQEDVAIPPEGQLIVDTGIQLVIPTNLCTRLIPLLVSSSLRIYAHTGSGNAMHSPTLKLLLQNSDSSEVRMTAGTFIVEAVILPIIHPTLNFENGIPTYPLVAKEDESVHAMHVQMDDRSHSVEKVIELQVDELDSSQISNCHSSEGKSAKFCNFKLTCLPTSCLHMMLDEQFPRYLTVPEINTLILLPEDDSCRNSIIDDVALMESQMMQDENEASASLIHNPCSNPEAVIQDFTQRMREQSVLTQTDPTGEDQSLLAKAKEMAHNSMCEKLAVVSVDLLKNQSMTRTMLAQTQQGDDYLSVIRDMVARKESSYPAKNFFIKNQVLYKRCVSSQSERHVICLPDVLLPAVIHFLHVNLGHSSFTVTKRNFEHYYYNRNATRMIKSYVQACVTCALSHKFDIHKGTPETKRSLEPTRPRQFLYCDILPMQSAGTMNHILFCLDAYSQFVYALPMKDKKADSVLQSLLSLFASTGWPEAIYMDNETSFRSAGKQLVKIAPVKVLYSVPYCQFQNWSENYIKNFKKVLIKNLTDAEHPHPSDEWHLVLPTVTQSLNRQVLPGTGLTRESIHFNMVTHFHPLAHLTSSSEKELNQEVNSLAHNWFQTIVEKRKRLRKGSMKSQIPEFHETQIVFMRDQAPAISSILKFPNKGPYRIEKLDGRNVVLQDLPTGKTVHSHVQFIRPLDLAEYRLLLSKNWDLNCHNLKAGQAVNHSGIFDAPSHPVPTRTVAETERMADTELECGELEKFFLSQPEDEIVPDTVPSDAALSQHLMPSASRPPDIDLLGPPSQVRRSPRLAPVVSEVMSTETDLLSFESENVSEENDSGERTFSCNALTLEMDLSKLYSEKLATAASENACPFSLGNMDLQSLCFKPVLKPKRTLSFSVPTPAAILFPEKM